MRLLVLGLFVASISASIAWIPNAIAQEMVDSSKQPLYINHAYGYRVALPSGVTYSKSVAPNPDHGIGIALENGAMLWVDASYTDTESTEAAVSAATRGCKIEHRRQILLGGRTAELVHFFCQGDRNAQGYYEGLVLTRFGNADRSPADYEVGLRAPSREMLSRYGPLFEKVVSGFKFEK